MAETTKKNLRQKLSAVMAGVEKLKKDGHNKFHNYDYVTEASVVESVRQLLVTNGVMPSESVKYHWQEQRATKDGTLDYHSFVLLNCRFLDTESDEVLESDWLGEGQDRGDKGFYKAYTGAQKYWLMKTLFIPTGDDPEDGNGANAPVGNTPAPTEAPAPTTANPGDISKAQLGMIKALCTDMAMTNEQKDGIKIRHNVDSIAELSKSEASQVITELLERFLNKVLSLAEQLNLTDEDRDALYDKHGLDVMKPDGKAIRAVHGELVGIAEGIGK